jgi:hypothetical protein
MSGRDYKRLGWTVPYPDAEYHYKRLASVVRRVAVDHDTADLALQRVASILEQLADNPEARQALVTDRRTGPKSRGHHDMAMDALAQIELEGPRRTKVAYLNVAQTWNVTAATVKNVLTTHRDSARRHLEDLINNGLTSPGKLRRQREGSPPEYWTREELLRALSLDLRDINGCDQRAPRKRRAPPKKSAKRRKSQNSTRD